LVSATAVWLVAPAGRDLLGRVEVVGIAPAERPVAERAAIEFQGKISRAHGRRAPVRPRGNARLRAPQIRRGRQISAATRAVDLGRSVRDMASGGAPTQADNVSSVNTRTRPGVVRLVVMRVA
jgi:hypothetical protein